MALLGKTLVVSLLLAALPTVGWGGTLEPLVVGWERLFRLDWQVGAERGVRPVVRGHLANNSPYTRDCAMATLQGKSGAGGLRCGWRPITIDASRDDA
jgi:hypothetical protein